MGKTKIEWADRVFNPITGCTPISEGCRNCYAARMAKRLAGRYGYPADEPFKPGVFHQDRLEDPLKWKAPQRVFICSMGDLFHAAVNDDDIAWVWQVMQFCEQHTFIVLTKRPERMRDLLNGSADRFGSLPNVWLGVSVENQETANLRIPVLMQTRSTVRLVSYEPALGPVDFCGITLADGDTLGTGLFSHGEGSGISWIIAGAETGVGARPAELDWFRSVRDQCARAGVPFFLKSVNAKHEVLLDGKQHSDIPVR